MQESPFLASLGTFVVAAFAVVLVARLLRIPSILSYLLAGLLVGPVLGLVGDAVEPHGALDTVAEVGIVLLLFLVGLELSLERVRQVGKVAVAAGLGQVVFTAAGGLLLCVLLGFTWLEGLFIATALTFSSTVVVVKLLDQKGELHTLWGRIAIGIFLVQDLVVVLALTFLSGLGNPDELEAGPVALGLLRAFGGMAGLLLLALLAARYVLPRPLSWAARSPRLLFTLSLAVCFGFVLLAMALRLSVEIGAFLAGLSIAQLGCAHELKRRVHPLMSFFVAIFFVSLGAGMQLDATSGFLVETVVLSLFVLLGNPLIFMLIIARFGYSEETCFKTSVTVAQISEFSFIFIAMGVSADLVGQPVLSLVALVGLITIAGSAYLILYSEPLYRLLAKTPLLRPFRAHRGQDEPPATDRPSGHVLVVGMNDLGRRVARALHAQGEEVLALDIDPRKLRDLPCRTMIGDVEYQDTLTDAGLDAAKLAVSALRIESTNKLFVFRCKERRVPVAVYGLDRAVLDELRALEPDYVIDTDVEARHRLVAELKRLGDPPR
jgi:Kef-type K+ transport system membrane component KefB